MNICLSVDRCRRICPINWMIEDTQTPTNAQCTCVWIGWTKGGRWLVRENEYINLVAIWQQMLVSVGVMGILHHFHTPMVNGTIWRTDETFLYVFLFYCYWLRTIKPQFPQYCSLYYYMVYVKLIQFFICHIWRTFNYIRHPHTQTQHSCACSVVCSGRMSMQCFELIDECNCTMSNALGNFVNCKYYEKERWRLNWGHFLQIKEPNYMGIECPRWVWFGHVLSLYFCFEETKWNFEIRRK